jgi:glucosamine--fructose-6-phosphate aminotransferase (isomerizing)
MCGIVGYIGFRQARPILLEGLKRLEYRGYDSAGIAEIEDDQLVICKAAGRISELEASLSRRAAPRSTIGIAHTRWATHGSPTDVNAHPHTDCNDRIALVHNGIIENYAALRQYLEGQGVAFRSETDSEVLAQLIGHLYKGQLETAVREALVQVQGTYGIAVLSADEPDRMVVARRGSPLIIGVGADEHILASDASAIVQHTSQVIYLSDGEVATLTRKGLHTTTLDARHVSKEVQNLELSLEQIELGTFDHYMQKEIFEQPAALRNCTRGRLDLHESRVVLGGIAKHDRELARARRIILTGCGTAWHAALIGEYLLEDFARVPAETEYASEFRYRNPVIEFGTALVAISQSGETADTLAALREGKERGATVLGVVNAVGSTIARETDAGIYLHVGPEIGVASTKAFTAQVAVLAMLAIWLGRKRHLSPAAAETLIRELARVPDKIEHVLGSADQIRQVTEEYCDRENWLYLGRGYNWPVALEGALKLKEISYIHAEGMPAAEMKHGPIALINKGTPAVFIATRGAQYGKVVSNVEEVRSRGGRIIAVATEGDGEIRKLADHVFYVPHAPDPLQPLVTVIPLQLMAYYAALARGCNVDKPRNLAKSVTVE